MNYRQLGNSGLVVSELCLGTMTFGQGEYRGFQSTLDETKASKLVSIALENGINFFDTADGYGNGQSEIILGKILKSKRKDVLVATKLSFRTGEQVFNAGVNAKHIIEQCHNSLKNLQSEYIDVLLLHHDTR